MTKSEPVTAKVPKPKYKIGDVVLLDCAQMKIDYAYFDESDGSWIYNQRGLRFRPKESEILYKL